MTFQKKIDYLMKKNKISSLKSLAEKTNIPYTTLMGWYHYGVDGASILKVKTLSIFLKCSLDFLTNDNDEINDFHDNNYEEFEGVELKFKDGYSIKDLTESDKFLLSATINSIKQNIDNQKNGN